MRDPADATRVKQIRQDGWTIDYLAYADAPATGVKRVNLVRATPPLDIKLVLLTPLRVFTQEEAY